MASPGAERAHQRLVGAPTPAASDLLVRLKKINIHVDFMNSVLDNPGNNSGSSPVNPNYFLEYVLLDYVAERRAAAAGTRIGEGDSVLRFVAWAAHRLAGLASAVERWAAGPGERAADPRSQLSLR